MKGGDTGYIRNYTGLFLCSRREPLRLTDYVGLYDKPEEGCIGD